MKAEIKEKLEKLEEIIANATDPKDVEKALKKYQEIVKKAFKLGKDDFVGDAHEDYKYGFRMPKECKNHTHCRWICDNMVAPDGISNNTMESSQNLDITDVEDDNDGFDSRSVVDERDDDEEEREDGDRSDGTTTGGDARLLQTDAEIDMVYTEAGFEADADSYEAGVSVDDDSWGNGVDGNDNSESAWLLWYVFLGIFVIVFATWGCLRLYDKITDHELTTDVTHHERQMVS